MPMKKGRFLTLFIMTHVGFIFLQIHKHMQFIKQSFVKQKNERILAQLEQHKQELTNQWYGLQNKSDIKKYALETLHMQPVKLSQLKRLNHDK